MKKQLTITAVVLVLAGSAWLTTRHLQRSVQPTDSRTPSAPADIAATHPAHEVATLPPQPVAPIRTVEPTSEVRLALKELENIYGQAGSLEWDAAKALIARRQDATQDLVARLAQLGPGGAQAIATAYSDADSTRAKHLLIHALAAIRDPEAAGVLQRLLTRADSFSLRKEIVLALRQRPEPAAERALANILANDDDPQLRFASVQALAGRENALPLFAERLRSESHVDVRAELVRSVGLIGSEQARDMLAGVAQRPFDTTLRQTAIQELSRSFGAAALEDLNRLLNDPDELIRKSTVTAISRVKDGAAIALLQRAATSDASPTVRDNAAAALTSIQPAAPPP